MQLACIASVSVAQKSEERGFWRFVRASKIGRRGVGEGKEGLRIFSVFRQRSFCCNQCKECRKQDHEFLLCPFGPSVLETSGPLFGGVECHFDAMIFQNSLYWLRGPTNVWNCAVALPGFCRVNYVLERWFRLAGIQDEALGVSIGL